MSQSFAGPAELRPFLAASRVLVCLLPSTRETRDLLDRRTLSQLPRGAHLVNVARGDIVVDEDLVALLDEAISPARRSTCFATSRCPRTIRSGIIRGSR